MKENVQICYIQIWWLLIEKFSLWTIKTGLGQKISKWTKLLISALIVFTPLFTLCKIDVAICSLNVAFVLFTLVIDLFWINLFCIKVD